MKVCIIAKYLLSKIFGVFPLKLKLVRLNLNVGAGLRHRYAQVLLDIGQAALLIVPDATAALVCEASVGAAVAAGGAPLAVVPHLLLHCGHQADGQAHPLGSAHPPYAVHVVALLVRQCHVDDKG